MVLCDLVWFCVRTSSAGAASAVVAVADGAGGLEVLIVAGATAIIQPGGSLKDNDVIAAADAAGIAMVFTGIRHFNH